MTLYVGARHIERVMSCKWRNYLATVRGEGGIASEEKLVGTPKFHSWGNYTMPLTNIQSDWMSNASSAWTAYSLIPIMFLIPLLNSHLEV